MHTHFDNASRLRFFFDQVHVPFDDKDYSWSYGELNTIPAPSDPVLVETVSTKEETNLSASTSTGTTPLFENPGETVPAPQEWHK